MAGSGKQRPVPPAGRIRSEELTGDPSHSGGEYFPGARRAVPTMVHRCSRGGYEARGKSTAADKPRATYCPQCSPPSARSLGGSLLTNGTSLRFLLAFMLYPANLSSAPGEQHDGNHSDSQHLFIILASPLILAAKKYSVAFPQ